MRKKYVSIILSLGIALSIVVVVVAGNPNTPPGIPEETSSYSLADLYNRLDSGIAGEQITFTEPISGPSVGTMFTINAIMDIAPEPDNLNGAAASNVLSNQTFWGLTTGEWGIISGTMPNVGSIMIAPTTTQQMIASGYHDGSGYVTGDSDLVSTNIAEGINLFGVTGTLKTVFAGIPKTGQTASYHGGDDGDLELGVAWPVPRFIDNNNGTVTDNLTGLIWLQDANCLMSYKWENAFTVIDELNDGQCGLTDGSTEGDWRMPNVREMQSLMDYGAYKPALSAGYPFTVTNSLSTYWTSTTYANSPTTAWYIYLLDGYVYRDTKDSYRDIWPVRNEQ